jgi:hypothetical protein
MLQLIEKQAHSWTLLINGKRCSFTIKPLALYHSNSFIAIRPNPAKSGQIRPNCDNGLRWKVGGGWVSYKQIKSVICSPYQ